MHTAAPVPQNPIRTSRRRLLALLTALSTMGLLATNLYLPSLPGLAADLGVSANETRLTLTVFLAGLTLGQLVVGPLSDRYGRRPVLLAGLSVYVAASLACAAAPGLDMLLAARAAQAVGACAGIVVVRAVARDLFDGEALTRAMAIIATLMATAPGFSPLAGGLIETVWGWRGAFVFIAAFGLACTLLVWRWIGETNAARGLPLAPGRIAAGYGALLKDVRFMAPGLATGFAIGALFSYFAGAPALIIETLGFSPLQFGVITAFTVFAVFAGGALGPRIARRTGALTTVTIGLALMVTGAAVMAALFSNGIVTFVSFLLPQLVFLAGLGIVNPVGTAAALQPFPDRAGAASAMLGFLQMGGGTLGTLLLTQMPGATPLPLPLTMGAIAVLGLATVIAIAPAARRSAATART